ncbi:hypothetical protein N0B44_25990 [Roseibacterium beibuensis]|uniref:hypothetical protein n=1 Tax=[Roseibacterium] beibuensis TaxID=1193142 RepID=UPI00217D8C45|nr:hypothetical protein [Roseibacterium beibuensis]MCS6626378.1 hypothetical protein [Roseibacterium beibuensis]
MRRTVVALLAVTALVAACEQSTGTPASETPAAATPEMPADAPPQEEVDPTVAATPTTEPVSCREQLGEAAAIRLVERCVQVSPASHPPCHPDNTCALIQGEIDRSCAMYEPGETRPEQCGA